VVKALLIQAIQQTCTQSQEFVSFARDSPEEIYYEKLLCGDRSVDKYSFSFSEMVYFIESHYQIKLSYNQF